MSIAVVLLLIGAILMFVSAIFEPAQVSLYKLAWGFFFLYFLFGAGALHLNG